ncbi:toxin [Acinetobacter chinensis]|uniref:Toxin n=1 Tax=Acinetobacter chinensis TaxID=2004650 RepID=A0A3B7LU69_9GAMM|nr:SRPBCC family protein [Acinetobacter chinensis]AXY55951.1 toxin [Acinetobacter chinensis]
MTSQVRLHRVFCAPVDRVYKAFTDADALAKWMSPYGFTAKVHHQDVREGGTYRMSFTNFSTGTQHAFHGVYNEVIPEKLLRYTDEFENPALPGKIQVTVEFSAVSVGTEVFITQSDLPDVIPEDGCYLGWQESLQQLALLVTPNIPDE